MAITMKRAKQRGKWRFIKWLFSKKIRETKCSTCGRPFLEYPDREPKQRFEIGDVEILLYESHLGRSSELYARVGVWRKSKHDFELHQLFRESEIAELSFVCSKALEFIRVRNKALIDKVAATKMSSPQLVNNQRKEVYGNKKKTHP